MKYSTCCHAELKKDVYVDRFHGADDSYELKVPVLVCSKCHTAILPTFSVDTNEKENCLKIS